MELPIKKDDSQSGRGMSPAPEWHVPISVRTLGSGPVSSNSISLFERSPPVGSVEIDNHLAWHTRLCVSFANVYSNEAFDEAFEESNEMNILQEICLISNLSRPWKTYRDFENKNWVYFHDTI